MTEAEELELLELEEKAHAQPAQVEPAKPVTLGAGATGAVHFARHIAAGLGDKILAAEEAISEKLYDKTGQTAFGDAYKRNLAFNDKLLDASDKEHPVARWVGNGLGLAGSAAALGGGAAASGLRPAALQGAKLGASLGAVGGFGASRADDASGAALDTAKGAAAGAALGGLLPVGGSAVGSATRRLVGGMVKPTEAAALLRAKGVPLTTGQMNPGGFLSRMEEAGQHSALGGPAIHDAQLAAREGWQNAVLNEARPIPGALRPGAPADKLAGVYSDFGPAYQTVRESPVLAGATGNGPDGLVALRTAFNRAAEDPGTLASEAQVGAVKRFLENQATIVDRSMEGGKVPNASALLEVRSNIRGAIRDALRHQDHTSAALLGNAEKAMTGGLEQQLPAYAKEALQAADSQYGKYRTVADAVARSGDQEGGFTPSHLSAAVRSASEKGAYARGGGGALRDLAQAGKEVLDAKQPSTGARLLHLPMGLNHAAGPLAALTNRPGIQAALLGETALQQALARQGGRVSAIAAPAVRSLLPDVSVSADDRTQALIEALRRRPQGSTP